MPRIRTAHKFSAKHRTSDVLTEELVDFKSLLLSHDVLKGLNSSGFERPSPIQLKAIPLGRCGLDLIAQAKSGTGKTCVFSVIALESIHPDSNTTQVLVLAPTREIAVQIKDVLLAIGSEMKTLSCHAFIGGINVEEDKKVLKRQCHVAVGTPGRIKFLIEHGFLKTESVRLFILDEADKLLDESFQEQINWIFSSLPPNKQMMAFSATYPEYLARHLTRYMREPTFVRLNATDPTLQGIRQFYQLVPFHSLPHKTFQEKVSQLLKLLSSVSFHQCLVFSNYQIRAQSLCETLCAKGWPSVFIAGSQSQIQRLKAMEKLKQFKCRVLISTDLTSRGIDAENVNLVVNMEVPRDSETYLHRIGRAGRFGTHGVAVTYVGHGDEEKLFRNMARNIGTTIDLVPGDITQSMSPEESKMFPSTSPQPVASSIEVDILKRNSASTVTETNQHKQAGSHATEPQDAGVRGSDVMLAASEEQIDTDVNVEKKEDNKEKTVDTEAPVQFSRIAHSSRDANSPSLRTDGLSENKLLLNFPQKCQISDKHYQETFENTAANEQCSSLVKPSDDSISVQDDTLQSNLLQYGCSGSEPKASTDSTTFAVSEDWSKEKHDVVLAHLKNAVQDGFGTVHQRLKETVLHLDGNQKLKSIKECNADVPDLASLDSPSSKSSDSHEEFESCGKLPSAAEFERDFEEYLKNSSSFLGTQENEKSIKDSMNVFSRENKLPVYSDSDNGSENQLHDIGVTSQSNQYFGHTRHDSFKPDYTYSQAHNTNIVGCDSQNLETFQVPYSQLYQLNNNHCCHYRKGPFNAISIGNNYCYQVDNTSDYSSSYFEQAYSSALDPFPNNHFHAYDDENCQHFVNPNNYYTDSDSQNYWRTCGPGYSAQYSHGSRSFTDMQRLHREDSWHGNLHTCKFSHKHKLQWSSSWCNAYWRQTTLLRDFLLYSKSFSMS